MCTNSLSFSGSPIDVGKMKPRGQEGEGEEKEKVFHSKVGEEEEHGRFSRDESFFLSFESSWVVLDILSREGEKVLFLKLFFDLFAHCCRRRNDKSPLPSGCCRDREEEFLRSYNSWGIERGRRLLSHAKKRDISHGW